METNIDKLEQMGILGDIRERLGIEENETFMDDKINRMDAKKIAELWSGWNLGDESWAREIINIYEEIKGD